MSHKRLQIFVSSTFEDLVDERQAAVEAILRARHIPAGMELFCAGNEEQFEVIRRWIDESDIYMLILGGRYGSLEDKSAKSYIELEYRYALDQKKPVFSLVITEKGLHEKAARQGKRVIESLDTAPYKDFRKLVMSKMIRKVDDSKDIKLGVMESVVELERTKALSGWIRGDETPDLSQIAEANAKLTSENMQLRNQLEGAQKLLERQKKSASVYAGMSWEEVKGILAEKKLTIPANLTGGGGAQDLSVYDLFIGGKGAFATGVANYHSMNEQDKFFFFKVAPELMTFGLVESEKLTRGIQRIRTSKIGLSFLAESEKRSAETASQPPGKKPKQ